MTVEATEWFVLRRAHESAVAKLNGRYFRGPVTPVLSPPAPSATCPETRLGVVSWCCGAASFSAVATSAGPEGD